MANRIEKLLAQDAVTVAKELIGWRLYSVKERGNKVGGTIIETEAYNQDDSASHSYKGRTLRTDIMFGPAGYLYVYFTYGMHWCMNIVTGRNGRGEAVLIRGIMPDAGLEIIRKRRNNQPDTDLTNGPAKVCQALGVTGKDNGAKLNGDRFVLLPPKNNSHLKIQTTKRIGITKDIHRPWRFIAQYERD